MNMQKNEAGIFGGIDLDRMKKSRLERESLLQRAHKETLTPEEQEREYRRIHAHKVNTLSVRASVLHLVV